MRVCFPMEPIYILAILMWFYGYILVVKMWKVSRHFTTPATDFCYVRFSGCLDLYWLSTPSRQNLTMGQFNILQTTFSIATKIVVWVSESISKNQIDFLSLIQYLRKYKTEANYVLPFCQEILIPPSISYTDAWVIH